MIVTHVPFHKIQMSELGLLNEVLKMVPIMLDHQAMQSLQKLTDNALKNADHNIMKIGNYVKIIFHFNKYINFESHKCMEAQ